MLIKSMTKPDGTTNVIVTAKLQDGSSMQVVRTKDDYVDSTLKRLVCGEISEDEFLELILETEDTAAAVAETVQRKLKKFTTHISCDGCHAYFDNDSFEKLQLDAALEDHIVGLLKSDADESEWKPWAAFCERLYTNVHPDIRERLFAWMTTQGWHTIDEQGRLVGYRGCQAGADGIPESVNTGDAIVDGVRVSGHIPNPVGSVVEMPRSAVQHDPSVGCSSGLHVGTLDYAKGWAPANGYILRVAVAPEDIVSVPFECDSAKIRCCRFEVLSAERLEATPTDEWRGKLTFFGFGIDADPFGGEGCDGEDVDCDWDCANCPANR